MEVIPRRVVKSEACWKSCQGSDRRAGGMGNKRPLGLGRQCRLFIFTHYLRAALRTSGHRSALVPRCAGVVAPGYQLRMRPAEPGELRYLPAGRVTSAISRRRADSDVRCRRRSLERGASSVRARTRRSLSSVELTPLFSKQKQLSGRRWRWRRQRWWRGRWRQRWRWRRRRRWDHGSSYIIDRIALARCPLPRSRGPAAGERRRMVATFPRFPPTIRARE